MMIMWSVWMDRLGGNGMVWEFQVFTLWELWILQEGGFVRKQALAMFWCIWSIAKWSLFIEKQFGFGWIVLDEGACYCPMDIAMYHYLNAKLQTSFLSSIVIIWFNPQFAIWSLVFMLMFWLVVVVFMQIHYFTLMH